MSIRTSTLAILFLAFVFVSCGGGNKTETPPQPITVTFTAQPPQSVQVGAKASLTVMVANDPSDQGVTWSPKSTTRR